jgi:2-polyprenyl-3-methyl-5-hydroxy-6-metoxy-1,4-benzoquinol methylase
VSDEQKSLTLESREIWNRNAREWDAYMGEGGGFQRVLIGPSSERLLALAPDELVLDIACGNGAFARRMAALGARVVASDFSEVFIERAIERTTEHADRITYHVVDATDEQQLLTLGLGRYDAAVCTMGMMDMATIDPLLSALRRLLKPGGRFVFSVMHPCFNGEGMKKFYEEEDRAGQIVVTRGIKAITYNSAGVSKGLGIETQPTPHFYFMRTLSVLLGAGFRAGFVVDALEEPVFPQTEAAATISFGWSHFGEIPPVLITRMRAPRTTAAASALNASRGTR